MEPTGVGLRKLASRCAPNVIIAIAATARISAANGCPAKRTQIDVMDSKRDLALVDTSPPMTEGLASSLPRTVEPTIARFHSEILRSRVISRRQKFALTVTKAITNAYNRTRRHSVLDSDCSQQ